MELAGPVEDAQGRAPPWAAGRLWLIFGPPALLFGIGSAALVVSSDAEPDAVDVLAVILPIAWGFVAAGVIAWSRAPENRTGRLMVATGFAWFLAALTTANPSLVFSLGVLLGAVAYAFLLHLYLAYPSGRLHSRLDLTVVVLAYLTVTLFRIPWLLFQEWPNDECPECPANSFLVADEPGIATAADATMSTVGIAIVGYVVVAMIRRWRSASPRARRVLAPVLLSGGATFVALIALLVCEVLWVDAANVVQWVVFALLVTVPAAFLVGLLRARLATAGASRFLIEAPPTPEEAQAALRRALGDPELELVYWLPERSSYVDIAGSPCELPPDGAGRMTTAIAYEGRPVAALVHDDSLRHEPELVEAVVAAARVMLERDRLAAELRARLVELQRERDFVATVVNHAPGLFCVVDLEGTVRRLNATGEALTGVVDDDALRARTFWDAFVVPEHAESVRRRLLDAGASLEPTAEVETEIRAPDGGRRVLAWSSTPIVDAQGRQRLLIAGTDVTERARHALELQRERDVLNTIADTAPNLLLIVDGAGAFTAEGMNAGAQRALGHTEAGVASRDFVEVVVAPEDAPRAREHFERSVAAGKPRELDSTWLTATGERLRVAWSATWLARADDGVRDLFLVCGVDISERKRQEDELRASRARIVEAADAERRRLERNLHDGAQQRLVTLSLSLRLVEARLGPDSEQVAMLRAARDELAAALDELRDLARGIHPAVLSDHGLGAALEALAARVPLPVDIDRAVAERLPEPVEVAAYYVVSEALANVQKYADASSVRIGVGRENGQAVVEVHDDGVGGADATSGSGLRGLADRVEALGGRLEVESAAGAGTTVRARIPV